MTARRPPCALRAAAPVDLDAIVTIERLAFSDPWSRHAFASLVGKPGVFFAVALGRGDATELATDAVVGYVVAWFAADESEIGNLAVAPSVRGRGVGAALLDAALAEAVAHGAAATYLEVRESNADARRLYASRGFAEVGRRRRYYRHPDEDALVLKRTTSAPTARVSPARVESAHRA